MIEEIAKFKVYIYLERRFQNFGETENEFHSSEWIWFSFYCQLVVNIFMKLS